MMREKTSAALARPDTIALSEPLPPVLAPPGPLIADSGLAPTEQVRASTAPGDCRGQGSKIGGLHRHF